MTFSLIASERVLLRDYTADDWEAVHEYACDLDTVKYLDWGPNAVVDSQSFIERAMKLNEMKPRLAFELAVMLKGQNRLIGGGTTYIINSRYREGSIGYCLNKEYWGQGFATEIAKTLLKFAFGELKLHRVFATAHPDNIASANVLRKMGMKHEGRLRDHKIVRGKWRDTDIFALLESDFKV